jgi:HPt (histidine-containing phosphotransfer) domain-containing protein
MSDELQPAFDAEEVCRWYDSEMDSILELVGLVVADLPRYAKSLEDAADAGDLQAVARSAHTIKGAVGNVCALRLCGIVEAIESGARSGDATRVASLRAAFRNSTMDLVDALTTWAGRIETSAGNTTNGTKR